MSFFLQLDRCYIFPALIDNMPRNLHMNANNYNTDQIIFCVGIRQALRSS